MYRNWNKLSFLLRTDTNFCSSGSLCVMLSIYISYSQGEDYKPYITDYPRNPPCNFPSFPSPVDILKCRSPFSFYYRCPLSFCFLHSPCILLLSKGPEHPNRPNEIKLHKQTNDNPSTKKSKFLMLHVFICLNGELWICRAHKFNSFTVFLIILHTVLRVGPLINYLHGSESFLKS